VNPIYILTIKTKGRGFTRKNLMTTLAHRFPSPYIVKQEGQLVLHRFNHEDDQDVVSKIRSFIEYITQHVPSTLLILEKQDPTRTLTKVFIDQTLEWKKFD
jgi:hypothetical protein